MAGGIGSRFWPVSRSAMPKQFLDILGTGKTLLQQTFDRFIKICPVENILIVTNSRYNELVQSQLPELKQNQILLEPVGRNTAPCIAYANYKIMKQNPKANVIVAPSDHLILDEPTFVETVKTGFEFTEKNNVLLTLGIKPHRPETGYGYIQIDNEEQVSEIEALKKVKTFTEKPNLEMAKVFVESGEFFWNSGIFIWSLSSIMRSFKGSLPDIDGLFEAGINYYNTDAETDFIEKTYAGCRNISIDYGVMEKADNVYVLCADFAWSDLGTWGSLYEKSEKDESNNAIKAKKILQYDTKNCIVDVSDDKLIVVQGLDGYIVAESANSLLICRLEDEQKIKQIVSDVKLELGEQYV